MDFITILGLCAGSLTTIAFIPQVVRVWQSKSAGDISLSMLILFIIGVGLWFCYGLYISQLPVIIANFITLMLNLVILWFKLKYK
jgi:MtN3 and saliva related transmembrane protein